MPMQVPLLDLKREYSEVRDGVEAAVSDVLAETRFINGPQVTELENQIAEYCGAKYAVGVASGTDSLLLALRAAGVGPDTEVITTTFSFFATAGTVANLGATPVFVDIEPDTYNLDVSQIEARITSKTRVIMPVHLFGQSADMEPILEIAKRHKLTVIEDAAQALSAKYQDRRVGVFGDMGCFSFYPTKNLGCAGDGGIIVTNSEELAARLRALKAHGAKVKYFHDMVGYNSRLDTIHAAILLAKLPSLDKWTEARRRNAEFYNQQFAGAELTRPSAKDYAYHIYNQYTIMVEKRDALKAFLTDKNIGYEIYYPLPLHLQKCFEHLGYREGDLPVSESCARQVISIPIYPQLTEPERAYVAETVLEFAGS